MTLYSLIDKGICIQLALRVNQIDVSYNWTMHRRTMSPQTHLLIDNTVPGQRQSQITACKWVEHSSVKKHTLSIQTPGYNTKLCTILTISSGIMKRLIIQQLECGLDTDISTHLITTLTLLPRNRTLHKAVNACIRLLFYCYNTYQSQIEGKIKNFKLNQGSKNKKSMGTWNS